MRVGIDVGGTFTDLAWWDGESLHTTKVPSTPADQSGGVIDAIDAAGVTGAALVHGTTVATNALLERSGARTVLVTDEGFEDLIEIARQDRPSLYDVDHTRPEPLVPVASRVGVAGRSDKDGALSHGGELRGPVERVAALQPEAVAVSTLFSFVDSTRERDLAAAIKTAMPAAFVSTSSEVAPEFREYERTSTTVINAYLGPLVSRYLELLGTRLEVAGIEGRPTVMRSSGGLIDLADAAALPASIVLSGPAGGVVAAAALGDALGHRSLISFDMGGTSTDVCRITDGVPDVAFQQAIGGLPNRMPSVAVHTVGAGGGSLAWIDPGGALRVGPQSAGAEPGPACYGRGGSDAAVTDADLLAGRLADGASLGSAVELSAALARTALERLGSDLGMNAAGAAAGIIQIVEAHMERAIRVVSVEQGSDPRDATLVAFGGAGGMHASALARRLGMSGVLIPPHAGVFSALGLLLAPPRSDVVRGILLEPGSELLRSALIEVVDEASARLRATTLLVSVDSYADVRYRGQSHELSIPLEPDDGWAELARRFHAEHERRNGFSRPSDPIEVVAVRAAAFGAPALGFSDLPEYTAAGDADRPSRPVLHGGVEIEAAVLWRPGLASGAEVVGPAVIEEAEATTYVGPGERATVHASGTLELEW